MERRLQRESAAALAPHARVAVAVFRLAIGPVFGILHSRDPTEHSIRAGVVKRMVKMPDDQKRREYRQLLEASAIGWMFPIAIGLGALWGWGMDKLFGTWPWLTAIFTCFGIAAAFVNLFRMAGRP